MRNSFAREIELKTPFFVVNTRLIIDGVTVSCGYHFGNGARHGNDAPFFLLDFPLLFTFECLSNHSTWNKSSTQ